MDALSSYYVANLTVLTSNAILPHLELGSIGSKPPCGVLRAFRQLAESGDILEIYQRWFVRRTPGGEQLNRPMSPQLEESFRVLGLR